MLFLRWDITSYPPSPNNFPYLTDQKLHQSHQSRPPNSYPLIEMDSFVPNDHPLGDLFEYDFEYVDEGTSKRSFAGKGNETYLTICSLIQKHRFLQNMATSPPIQHQQCQSTTSSSCTNYNIACYLVQILLFERFQQCNYLMANNQCISIIRRNATIVSDLLRNQLYFTVNTQPSHRMYLIFMIKTYNHLTDNS
jgi:hypothetical protein